MVDCYAQRVLNPFRGAMQVIRHEAAEAVTMDGVNWDIYVRNDSLLAGTESASGPVQVSEARFGRWSPDAGLKRGPLYPSEDFYRMERMGMVLYEQLRRLHDQVPFPFRDRYERWLLTAAGAPLVLLDSALERYAARPPGEGHWRIGLAAQEQFRSDALSDCRAAPGTSAGRYLMDYVNGLGTQAVWFQRAPDGSGSRLDGGATDAGTLPADAFPSMLIRTAGHDAAHARLLADFFAWQSPWLLLLAHLDTETRIRLERQARHRAAEVARQFHLYPECADPEQIQAARVEAMLTEPGRCGATECGDDMSTFYIELNPSGAE